MQGLEQVFKPDPGPHGHLDRCVPPTAQEGPDPEIDIRYLSRRVDELSRE